MQLANHDLYFHVGKHQWQLSLLTHLFPPLFEHNKEGISYMNFNFLTVLLETCFGVASRWSKRRGGWSTESCLMSSPNSLSLGYRPVRLAIQCYVALRFLKDDTWMYITYQSAYMFEFQKCEI